MSTPPERRLIAIPGTDEVVEAVIGYRSWRLVPDDGTVWLKSVYNAALWPQGAPLHSVCRCVWGIHTCGIYAWVEPPSWTPNLNGEVALWGDVRFHTLGMRASHALPIALYDDGGASPAGVGVAALQYGIPLVRLEVAA